jgi:hypothetical protein
MLNIRATYVPRAYNPEKCEYELMEEQAQSVCIIEFIPDSECFLAVTSDGEHFFTAPIYCFKYEGRGWL